MEWERGIRLSGPPKEHPVVRPGTLKRLKTKLRNKLREKIQSIKTTTTSVNYK